MKMSRVWAMPSSDTFSCYPIGDFVKRYIKQSSVSIDPFSRNNKWATYTNDLNPQTKADKHMFAVDFLKELRDRNIKADLIIFDPPYSLRQVKECYDGIGGALFTQKDTQNAIFWGDEKDICSDILLPNGIFLHFGWHSNGMGKKRGCAIEELLVVAHGGAHNDTICIAERKEAHQMAF